MGLFDGFNAGDFEVEDVTFSDYLESDEADVKDLNDDSEGNQNESEEDDVDNQDGELDNKSNSNQDKSKVQVKSKNFNTQNKSNKGLEVEQVKDFEDIEDKNDSETPAETNLKSLVPYALSLKEAGVLQNLDEKLFENSDVENHPDLLKEAMDEEINNRIKTWINGMNPESKNVIDLILKGVPPKEAIEANSMYVNYSKLDPDNLGDNEEFLRNILLEDKLSKGLSKEEALEEIESYSDLERPAKLAAKRLKSSAENAIKAKEENLKQQEGIRRESMEKAINTFKKVAETTNEVIPGIKINANEKTKIVDLMLNPVETKEGKISAIDKVRRDNPAEFDFKLAYIFNLTNGFSDFSKIKTGAKSDALRDLQKSIDTADHKRNSKLSNTASESENKTLDILSTMFKV